MNDEQRTLISAFNDGELDAPGQQRAQQLLRENCEAREFLASLRELDDQLRSAFAPVLQEPIPARIYATLHQQPHKPNRHLAAYLALAASLVLVAVLVVRQNGTEQRLQQQLVEMQQEIAMLRHQTLEHMPSGAAAAWVAPAGNTRAEITPLKTYRTNNNRFCREYEERITDARGVEVRHGIACREAKGHWPDLPTGRQEVPAADSATGTASKRPVVRF